MIKTVYIIIIHKIKRASFGPPELQVHVPYYYFLEPIFFHCQDYIMILLLHTFLTSDYPNLALPAQFVQ